MQTLLNLLSVNIGIIGGADGPTAVFVAGDLPWPAIAVAVFGVIFVAYVYIAKAINAKKAPDAPAAEKTVAAPAVAAPAAPVYTGPALVGVEEKEAAVIMAIVSHQTGIPLNRLRFESIKLLED